MRSLLAIAAIVVSAGLTYGRIFYGVDFTDEAFYVAVPYRFVLGARPLVDETNIVQQTPAVLLFPFVALWNGLFGVDGLVLYARHLHFLFTFGVGYAVFVSLRRLLGDKLSSAVYASAAIAFVPFGIHALSYNTFASGFFTAGCFLGAAWAVDKQPGFLLAAGSAHGLAIFTYPTFVLPVACFFAVLYATFRSARELRLGLLPTAIGTLATLLFFVHRGFGTIEVLVRHTSEFGEQGGDLGELADIASFVWSSFTYKHVSAALLIAAAVLRLWKPRAALVPLLLVPLAALPTELRTSASANEFVTSFALLAPFVFLLIRDSVIGRRLLSVVWLPAAVAGLTTALSSANGPIAVAIGFFPALIVTAVMIGLVLQRVSATDFAPAVVLLAVGVTIQYLSVYRDAGITNLTAPVGDGAYAGILTTSVKRDYLRTLERDLAAASGRECRIVFYDTFPAGYLLGQGRSATNATWLLDVADDQETRYQQLLLDYYDEHGGLPDIAVRLDRIPLTGSDAIAQTYAEHEPLERVFAGPAYETAGVREDYRITRASRSACRRP